jgi:hypothetical protein
MNHGHAKAAAVRCVLPCVEDELVPSLIHIPCGMCSLSLVHIVTQQTQCTQQVLQQHVAAVELQIIHVAICRIVIGCRTVTNFPACAKV